LSLHPRPPITNHSLHGQPDVDAIFDAMADDVVARGALSPAKVGEARERVEQGTLPSTALLVAGAPPDAVLHALSHVAGAPPAPPRNQWRPDARMQLSVDDDVWRQLLAIPVGEVDERPLIAFAEVARMGSSLARALPDHVPCVALESDVQEALVAVPTVPAPSAVAFLAPPSAVGQVLRVGATAFGSTKLGKLAPPGQTSSGTFVVPFADDAARESRGPRAFGPGDRCGRFVLSRSLGRGGMATVYLGDADDGVEPAQAAIKVLHDHLVRGGDGEALRKRFRREVETMRQLQHPNIVACVDAGGVGGTEYFAAEYVDGGSLRDLLNRTGKLPPALVLVFLGELLDGLAHAHARGVIHRDLKPDNLLLATDGTLKIADFGIARVAEGTTLTATGGTIGTPAYMSPEQALAQPVDVRSDLYSVAVICYEALTGRNPFQADSAGATLANVVLGKVTPVGEVEPSVRFVLDVVLTRLLSLRPDDRLPSAAHVRAALSPMLDALGPAAAHWAALVGGDNRGLGKAVIAEADELARVARAQLERGEDHHMRAGLSAFRATALDPGHREAKAVLSELSKVTSLRFSRSTTPALFELESRVQSLPGDQRREAYREIARAYAEENNPCFAASFLRRSVASFGEDDDDLAALARMLPDEEIEAVRALAARVDAADGTAS
jgi:serine/threonine protein kinase